MKRIALFLLAFAANTAFCDEFTTAFAKCAVVKDDRTRLACYDKIRDDALKASPAPNGYQQLPLVDLKVDLKKMVGKKVSVGALIQVIGDTSFLKSDEMDMAPIFANAEQLPREDRKKLASGCQMLLCKGVFYGVVKQTTFGLGVALDRVEWR